MLVTLFGMVMLVKRCNSQTQKLRCLWHLPECWCWLSRCNCQTHSFRCLWHRPESLLLPNKLCRRSRFHLQSQVSRFPAVYLLTKVCHKTHYLRCLWHYPEFQYWLSQCNCKTHYFRYLWHFLEFWCWLSYCNAQTQNLRCLWHRPELLLLPNKFFHRSRFHLRSQVSYFPSVC